SGAARPSGGAGSASPQTSTTTPKPSRPSTTGSNAGSPAPLSAPALTTAQAGQAAARRPQRRGALTLPPPDVAPIAPAPTPAISLRRPPRTDDDPFAPLGVRAGSLPLRPALEAPRAGGDRRFRHQPAARSGFARLAVADGRTGADRALRLVASRARRRPARQLSALFRRVQPGAQPSERRLEGQQPHRHFEPHAR